MISTEDRWLDQVLDGTGEIAVEIAVAGNPDECERRLLDVPWEWLASDEGRLFRVVRRLGRPGEPPAPRYRDLALLFMAADVEGQGALSYEQEEAAILQATRKLELNLSVEESGALEFLSVRLAQDEPFDALHLSCHGDIAERNVGDIAKGQPFLALESPEGLMARVGTGALTRALGEEGGKPALVFLSACRTGEHGATAPGRLALPYGLIRFSARKTSLAGTPPRGRSGPLSAAWGDVQLNAAVGGVSV